MRIPRIARLGCYVALIAASNASGQTTEPSKNNAQLVTQFSREFRAARLKSYQQSADFGRAFVMAHPSVNFGNYVLSLLSDPDPRLRSAALSAATASSTGDPISAVFLKRGFYDPETKNRNAALDLTQEAYRRSLELLEPVVDVSIRDPDRAIRLKAGETLDSMLLALATQSERAQPTLEQIRTDLNAQVPLSRDPSETRQLQATIHILSETIDHTASARKAAEAGENAKRLPTGRLNRISAWIARQSKPTFLLLITTLIIVLTHSYYLLLFVAFPSILFTFLYRRYPLVFPPYVARPDLYKRTLRPAVGLLRTLRDPDEAHKYLEYAQWLPIAARAMVPEAREKLSIAIAETLQNVTEEPLRASLFGVLSEINPPLALRMMDLKPEDPEIRAARRNMNKIMELPPDVFDRPGIELAHALEQATTISGDFYNVLTRAVDSYAIYMVDVNYHGLPASQDAMQAFFALKAARDWGTRQPRLELEAADELIRDMGGNLWINMNFLEIDLASRTARYASAGMPPALLFKRNQPEPRRLTAVGQYIGSGYSFVRPEPTDVKEEIGGGDLIVLCSDGILEARGTGSDHPFGESRLIATVKTFRDRHVNDIVKAILQNCKEYSGRARPQDDQSVVVIRIKSVSQGSATPRPAHSLNVSSSNEMVLRATVRRERDWPKTVNGFTEEYALGFARAHLKNDAAMRLRVALQEVLYNSLCHGTDLGEYVSIEITQLPGGKIEAAVTQQREWTDWDVNLGAQRRRELSEAIRKMRLEPQSDALLGGATLIASFADEIICKGRRLSLRFHDRENSGPASDGGTHD